MKPKKSVYEVVVECVVTVPFHAYSTKKENKKVASEIVRNIREIVRYELSYIDIQGAEDCSKPTRIRVARIDYETF